MNKTPSVKTGAIHDFSLSAALTWQKPRSSQPIIPPDLREKPRRPVNSDVGPLNMTLDPQLTGNAGLYYCCYQLSLRGWNVMPTARNARGVDIIAYSQDATRKVAIQVKALSKRHPVPLGGSLEKVMGDFWVIVNKVVSSSPSAFVLLPSEVKELAHRGEKEGRVSFWLQPTSYDQPQFQEQWERIGHG